MERRLPELAVVAVFKNGFWLCAFANSFHLFGCSVVMARPFCAYAWSLNEIPEGSRIRASAAGSPAVVRAPVPSNAPSDERPPGPPVVSKALVLATRLNRVLFILGRPSITLFTFFCDAACAATASPAKVTIFAKSPVSPRFGASLAITEPSFRVA